MKRALKIAAISGAVVIAAVAALYFYAYGDFIWRAVGDWIVLLAILAVMAAMAWHLRYVRMLR